MHNVPSRDLELVLPISVERCIREADDARIRFRPRFLVGWIALSGVMGPLYGLADAATRAGVVPVLGCSVKDLLGFFTTHQAGVTLIPAIPSFSTWPEIGHRSLPPGEHPIQVSHPVDALLHHGIQGINTTSGGSGGD